MEKRYSGTLEINVTLAADNESYNAQIVELNDDARFEPLEGIRPAPAFAARVEADSPEAYDEAARVAVMFAILTGDDVVYHFAEVDEAAEVIVRRQQ
jgi:hypothetical protein